jgi:hypothetical protein
MQFSLRTLFLLVFAAAFLVSLAKALPPFRGLMLTTALLYVGIAGLWTVVYLTSKRGHVLLPAVFLFPAVVMYVAALGGTVAIVLGLVLTGVSML